MSEENRWIDLSGIGLEFRLYDKILGNIDPRKVSGIDSVTLRHYTPRLRTLVLAIRDVSKDPRQIQDLGLLKRISAPNGLFYDYKLPSQDDPNYSDHVDAMRGFLSRISIDAQAEEIVVDSLLSPVQIADLLIAEEFIADYEVFGDEGSNGNPGGVLSMVGLYIPPENIFKLTDTLGKETQKGIVSRFFRPPELNDLVERAVNTKVKRGRKSKKKTIFVEEE
jgi:hypothetical protein